MTSLPDDAIEAVARALYEVDRDQDETVPWGDFRPTDVASIVLASVSKIRASVAVRTLCQLGWTPPGGKD